MSTEKTFRLDGKAIPFEDGDTVMDAALRAGEYIPHLCHNPDYEPHGSCRICVVDINGKHQCSCTLPASEGMDVDNSSEAIVDTPCRYSCTDAISFAFGTAVTTRVVFSPVFVGSAISHLTF